MYLQSLQLFQFKNYSKASFSFHPLLNVLSGKNGSGKTNVLDAIHYLCLGKSYFHYSDVNVVEYDASFFRVEGRFGGELQTEVSCTYETGGKKNLVKDGISYARIVDHVGVIPAVMITPDDQLLIDEGSEERRRFIDNTICQVNRAYLQALISYNKVLQQRNAALRLFAERGAADHKLIESYDLLLSTKGTEIHSARKKYFAMMEPQVQRIYNLLASENETVAAAYESICCNEILSEALRKNFSSDLKAQRTLMGIHRDDFDFLLNGHSLKKYGSQGQKKSFLLALKLAQFQLIKQENRKVPLLLLDDLFDKLDDTRSAVLLEMLSDSNFGQVFITDAHIGTSSLSSLFDNRNSAYFSIDKGLVNPMKKP